MKKGKQITGMILALLAAVLLLPVQATAAGSIDPERPVSLLISYQAGNTPLAGAAFDLYLVATVDTDGTLTPTADFAQYSVEIPGRNDDAWRALATTLESYVLRDDIPPADSGKTDAQGKLQFPGGGKVMRQGLYLVLGHRHTQAGYIYDAQPFLVMLPSLDVDANEWLYAVQANPKYCVQPESAGETIARSVVKVWKDAGCESQRPSSVTIQLLRNGSVYDTVTLNAENNWCYTWTGLDNAYRWTVAEKALQNYTVRLTQEDSTFVVTNTYCGAKLPQTGQLWWPVLLLAAAGLVLLAAGLLCRRREK